MKPKPCPHCNNPIDLSDQADLKPDLSLACPHSGCGNLLRTVAPSKSEEAFGFRSFTIDEAGRAHHEVLAKLLDSHLSCIEWGWSSAALALLLNLRYYLLALANAEGTAELVDAAKALVDERLPGAIDRTLLDADLKLTGLNEPTNLEMTNDNDA